MPAVPSPIMKAATPEQLSWRARIARGERGVLEAFLAWVAGVRAQITDAQVASAIITRASSALDHALQAVTFQPVVDTLRPVTAGEAARELEQLVRRLDPTLHISLDLRDPGFLDAVDAQGARLVREVTDETRRAIRNAISRAYTDGVHPYVAAPEIRKLVGLTSRQAQAVLNYRATLEKAGRKADQVERMTGRYADRMLTRRARTIARTETARAATQGRLESWRQAAAHGLFDYGLAEMEWSSVQHDPTEICAILDGSRVPLGSTWPGGLLPGAAHPNCRCAPVLVLPSSGEMVDRLRARIPEVNAQVGIRASRVRPG